MSKLEKVDERAFTAEAEADGWVVHKLTFPDCRGAGDRIYGKDGRTVLIEWKRKGKEPTRQQFKRLRELRQAFGWDAYCVDNIADARIILGIT
ncbi:MAG: hypothetical protein ACRYGR_08310 [Janthinobacterium lividum]